MTKTFYYEKDVKKIIERFPEWEECKDTCEGSEGESEGWDCCG